MNQSGNNWSKLASKFAFAHNTSVNYTTGQTPYEIRFFGTKPQVPMTLKLGLLRDKDKQGKYEFCDGLQSHTTVKTACLIILLTAYLDRSFPTNY